MEIASAGSAPGYASKCLTARQRGDREIAIRDLAHQIAVATGFTGELVWDASKPNGQPRRRLDVTRAHERFGFTGRTSFAEGLRRTVAWAEDALARGRCETR